jgi:hypothetical protein
MGDNEDRRQVDIDLTDIKVNIAEIKIHMERSVPAMEQVWQNEKDIIRIEGFQRVVKYVGGLTVVTSFAIAGKMIYNFISKHPPPPMHP